MIAPEFLDLDEILEIHALQLDEFGGIAGVRDRGLLESAVEQPRATAFGELLHADLFEMAAAYSRRAALTQKTPRTMALARSTAPSSNPGASTLNQGIY